MVSPFARQRRRRPVTASVLFAIIACSFLLLSSVTFTPAAARQDDLDDETTTLAEETAVSENDVTAESTEPVTTETPEAPELFWLVINKFDCNDPATAPYGSTTLADYQAACPNPMSAQFEAHNDYGYYDLQVGSAVTFEAPVESTTVSEMIPTGYLSPAIFCDYGNGSTFENDTNTSVMVNGKAGDTITCTFFNRIIPADGADNATPEATPGMPGETGLLIWKYECPAGYDVSAGGSDPLNDCTTAMNGVTFTLDHPDANETDLQSSTGDSIEGAVSFGSIAPAEYLVIETPPPGIESAFIWNCFNNGELMSGVAPFSIGFSAPLTIEDGDNISCNWFNVPEAEDVPTETPEPGYTDLVIYKYTCPAGYSLQAATANPAVDCSELTNDITFTLADEDPSTVDLQTDTGDSIEGAVFFGSLEPGTYTITETVPDGIASVFVLDCENALDGMVRPSPFSTGEVLSLPISGYEGTITCHWYNVSADPYGTLTIVKYTCTTEHFVSEVDCEILETGQGFDLLWWNGASWDTTTYGVTDDHGQLGFTGLEGGSWWIEEHNQNWCNITSDDLSADGTWLDVDAGEETIVKVYNCGAESSWSTPTRYPNTGVAPATDRPTHS